MIKLILIILLFISGNISASNINNSTNLRKRKIYVKENNNFKKRRTPKVTVLPVLEIDTIEALSADDIMALEGTTIVFWDVDETLLRKKFAISNFPKEYRNKLIDSALLGENYYWVKNFKNYLETDSAFHERVEMQSANQLLIQELHTRGAFEAGLTARKKSVAARTTKSLNNVGIDFTKLSHLGDHRFDITSEAIFRNGILYTGNSEYKVELIPRLVKNISSKLNLRGPFRVFHIDDSTKEIKAFKVCDLRTLKVDDDITIRPIYYRAHDKYLSLAEENLDYVIDEIRDLYNEYLVLQ